MNEKGDKGEAFSLGGIYLVVNNPEVQRGIMAASWFVLRCKPNKEEFFWGLLIAHQIEVYYPCIRAKAANQHIHKDKPYFPCHLFIHVDLQEITPSFLYCLPGSRGLLVFDAQPAPVQDGLIAAIRRRMDQINGTGGELSPGFQAGQTFSMQEYPFTGYESIFDDHISVNERVHILLKILHGEQMPVELSGVVRT